MFRNELFLLVRGDFCACYVLPPPPASAILTILWFEGREGVLAVNMVGFCFAALGIGGPRERSRGRDGRSLHPPMEEISIVA